AEASADRRQMGELVVGAQGEHVAVDRAESRRKGAYGGFVAIEADQRMSGEIGEGPRRAMPLEIVLAGKEAERDLSDMAGDERILVRGDHADGDVGLAGQQVFDPVGED